MLQEVVSGKVSLVDLKQAARRYRALQTIQKAFSRCTNTTWSEAEKRFPGFTSETRLHQFMQLDFSKGVPEAFMSYCQAALQSEGPQLVDSLPTEVYSLNGCRGYVIQQDILTLTYTALREAGVRFNGAHLFVSMLPKV